MAAVAVDARGTRGARDARRRRGERSEPYARAALPRVATQAAGHPDYGVLLSIAALLAFGLIMVCSASIVTAYTLYHNQYYFLVKQSIAALIGLGVMLALMRLDYHHLAVLALPGLVLALVLLAAVLVPGLGTEAYGAQRWISLPGFQLQPSEFAKVALIVYMSHWLAVKREQVRDFAYGLLPFTILIAIVVGLMMKQPDLGTTSVVVTTATAIFFASGAHPLHLGMLVSAAALGIVPLIKFEPYRMARFLTFLDPWERPLGNGYHVVQALLAFGAGGLTGVGLGVGRQKFMYLPFPHTDSIFAVIGEELGLVGTVGVLALFIFFAYRGLRVAWYAPDQLGRLLATGVTCGITFQAMINMGVLTSSLPFTGITLPLVSYGGSSLIATLASCGILLSVSRRAIPPEAHAQSEDPSRRRFWRRYGRPHLPGLGRRQRAAGA